MCGIAGYVDLTGRRAADPAVLRGMLSALSHRGPDGQGEFVQGVVAMGMRRLAIIDLQGSQQPLRNESGEVLLFGNGEIFNYRELRRELEARGHRFRTDGDLEVVVHLYEDFGDDFVHHLNGQFSLALLDLRRQRMQLLRDHFGITPLHYGVFEGTLVFASEVKAMLRHPLVPRRIDLQGIDQIICFPGLVSPRTMFEGVSSLAPGSRLTVSDGGTALARYWDLSYPEDDGVSWDGSEDEWIVGFDRALQAAVDLRMRADTPVGVYLSGGLDSSLVAAMMRRGHPDKEIPSFSIVFPDSTSIDERRFQRLVAKSLHCRHHEIEFQRADIASRLQSAVWHSECPVKETYNTCTMALAQAAREAGVPVVLGGEGADELLGGYPGYRFDQFAAAGTQTIDPAEAACNARLWGAEGVRYERHYGSFSQWRRQVFSDRALEQLGALGCLAAPVVDTTLLRGRHRLHQRSCIDVKARLGDHLLGDHGDRMNMAYSIEGRYPFLDRGVCDFLINTPPELKLRGLQEKYLLKQVATGLVPERVRAREKFGFRAPGSPYLLSLGLEWIDDMLSSATLARQGYLNVDWISSMVAEYRSEGRTVHPHLEDDVVLLALTLGIFIDQFEMPAL